MADRLDEADRVLSATIDDARRQQANYRVGPLLAFRSDVRFRAGALRDAVGRRRGRAHAPTRTPAG